MKLEDLIQRNDRVTADGGMGTMLIARGLKHGDVPELWNVERPNVIRQIHHEYIESGAQIILTNSFGGNQLRLARGGCADRMQVLNQAAGEVARQAAGDHSVVIGGSIGPLGAFIEPMGTLAVEQATQVFAAQATALAAGGVDVFWIETMSDLNEVQAAVNGCRAAAPSMPIVATMTFDTKGRTMMGVTPEKAGQFLGNMGLVAFGANCGNGPQEIETVIAKMHAANPQAVLVAKSNAGLPHLVNGVAVYDSSPDDMGLYARHALQNGARIVGACCGSTPAHIKAIHAVLNVGSAAARL